MKPSTTRKCFQCNSDLIFVSETTETVEGSRFVQTHSIYRCSNAECQKEIDKQTAKRVKLKKEREVAEQERAKMRMEKKKKLAEVL